MFSAVPPSKLLLAAPKGQNLGPYSAYATLAFGSALALFLYPHSVTGVLSASNRAAISRNAAYLPAYLFLLALIALLGFMAIAAGVAASPIYAPMFKQYGPNFAVPALILAMFPAWFAGLAFAAIAIGAQCQQRSCRSRPRIYDAQRLSRVHPLHLAGWTIPCYAALAALAVNLIVVILLTPLLGASRRGEDETEAAHYV